MTEATSATHLRPWMLAMALVAGLGAVGFALNHRSPTCPEFAQELGYQFVRLDVTEAQQVCWVRLHDASELGHPLDEYPPRFVMPSTGYFDWVDALYFGMATDQFDALTRAQVEARLGPPDKVTELDPAEARDELRYPASIRAQELGVEQMVELYYRRTSQVPHYIFSTQEEVDHVHFWLAKAAPGEPNTVISDFMYPDGLEF